MGYILSFLMGMILMLIMHIFIDMDAKYFYEKLEQGEKICCNNGGVGSFDLSGNFYCKDGAVFYTGE